MKIGGETYSEKAIAALHALRDRGHVFGHTRRAVRQLVERGCIETTGDRFMILPKGTTVLLYIKNVKENQGGQEATEATQR